MKNTNNTSVKDEENTPEKVDNIMKNNISTNLDSLYIYFRDNLRITDSDRTEFEIKFLKNTFDVLFYYMEVFKPDDLFLLEEHINSKMKFLNYTEEQKKLFLMPTLGNS